MVSSQPSNNANSLTASTQQTRVDFTIYLFLECSHIELVGSSNAGSCLCSYPILSFRHRDNLHVAGSSAAMDDAAQAADTSGSGSQYSVRMSVSSVAGISNEVEAEVGEASPAAAADKVFVALGADVKHGKSTLQWALQNLAKDGTKIVIAHVHRPAQMVPMSKAFRFGFITLLERLKIG